ncbi:MAG: MFS transporter [Thermoflexibacteraceae bacterium]
MTNTRLINPAVVVAALGYFVDIYDLILFSIVRIQSLKGIGITDKQELLDKGLLLLDMQMLGMLVGGILWGVLGDKKGRLSVLFGSIFLYSLANIANGMVENVTTYAIWRFIAGVGLAGELGAGITLVAEVLPKEKRGYGTMIVATVGLTGALAAGFIAQHFDWRTCYFIGGGLGMALLALRIGVHESGMFGAVKAHKVNSGDFLALFTNRQRLFKYLRCVFVGLPTWFVIGILVSFAPEFGEALGLPHESISTGTAIMCAYGGLVLGDLASGLISQLLRSRLRVMALFLLLDAIVVGIYLNAHGISLTTLYLLCGLLGFSVGFWVIFVTIAAEQFGTNIRATVTTTVPNFARGSLIPLTALFKFATAHLGLLYGAMAIGIFSLGVAFWCLSGMKETFDEDLNYMEEI